MNYAKQRLLWALVLTGFILTAEIAGGFWTRSLALLSDASHVFLDFLALGMSYVALKLASLPPDDRHTYGFHRLQVLAALANGATLLLVVFGILREAWERLWNPEVVLAGPMLLVATVGLGANILAAILLREHDHSDLNMHSAFLHVLGDALSSVGVIIGGLVMLWTGWFWVDPLIGALIGLIILKGAGRVLREATHILLEGIPTGIKASQVAEAILQVPGVQGVHDLHIWTISPNYTALSAHIVLADQALSQAQKIMEEVKHSLASKFGIEHTTLQVECESCGQEGIMCVMEPKKGLNHAHQASVNNRWRNSRDSGSVGHS